MNSITETNFVNVHQFLGTVVKPYRSICKDTLGDLYRRFRVLRDTLLQDNTVEVLTDLDPLIESLLVNAETSVITNTGLNSNAVKSLEGMGVNIALVPMANKEDYTLVLESEGIAFTRVVKVPYWVPYTH